MFEADLDGDGNVNYEESVAVLFKVKSNYEPITSVIVYRSNTAKHQVIRRKHQVDKWMRKYFGGVVS